MNKIDGKVDMGLSNFKFNKDMANIFDSHVRKSVPMYEEFHKIISSMSNWFVREGTNIYDLGCSTGEFINNLYNIHKSKNIKIIGVDSSEDMVEKATNRFSNIDKIEIYNRDLTRDSFINNSTFVASILTLQFVDQFKRQEIINNIYNGLNKGGAFILVEKVMCDTSLLNDIYSGIYNDFKDNQGFTSEEIINKSQSIRGVMQPLTLEDNMSMLRNANFSKIETFFRWCNFIGIVAVK